MNETEHSPLQGQAFLRILVIGLIAVGVVGGILWFVLNKRSTGGTNNSTTTNTRETVNTAPPFDTRVGSPPLDSDQDGLTNDEETALGTNPTDPDTDRDELTDYNEARLYRSDPLKSDTDADGNLDGIEVNKGFNPNGAGRLFEANPALVNATN